jgi:hypothetical protein
MSLLHNNALTSLLRNNSQTYPLRINALTSPLRNSALKSPLRNNAVTSPLRNNALNAPLGNNALTSHLRNNALTSPLRNNAQPSPLRNNALAVFNKAPRQTRGTQWLYWLRHHGTSRKVVDSIPDVVIRFFNWPILSSRNMAPELTQAVTKFCTTNLAGGKGRPALKFNNLTAICEPIL